jgi:hypothetical protein
MPKSDLQRRIDDRPSNGSGLGAGGVLVTPSAIIPAATEFVVGRDEGPHAGLFRLLDNTVLLKVVDTANVPFLSAGAVDYRTNTTFLNIGYAGKPGIRLPLGDQTPGAAEQIRGMEVDAETLVGMLPPDIIPLAAINSSMIDWGLVGLQVSAADVPIADAGGYYSGGDVEAALQEIGGYLPQIGLCYYAANVYITDAGSYFASTEVEGALQEIGADMAYIMANWPA